MGVLNDPSLQSLIDGLQAKSVAQEAETNRYFGERAKKGDLSWDGLDEDANRFMADNTGGMFRHAYRHFFEYVNDPTSRLRSMTLPFQGGLEMVVRV